MNRLLKRALADIRDNRFLNAITVVTIALAILISSAFGLFFINASRLMTLWQQGVRVMVYLQPQVADPAVDDLRRRLEKLPAVGKAVFISREEGLARLKKQLEHQLSLLTNLKANPLPHAFEVQLRPTIRDWEEVAQLAAAIQKLPGVDEVEYGQGWLDRFAAILRLFKLSGFGMCGLFFIATVFIVANTTRLVLYGRREEIEIMRLVGASEGFIRAPLYLEGLLQGVIGAAAGLTGLLAGYLYLSAQIDPGLLPGRFEVRFFPPALIAAILGGSMLAGWLGSFLSLRQQLKT
ncbi:MAG: permease-like cell division protein FtsX [Desulfobacterales bacterium]|jgi:cell division transport system permease protein